MNFFLSKIPKLANNAIPNAKLALVLMKINVSLAKPLIILINSLTNVF